MKQLKKDAARVMDEAVARGEAPCVLCLFSRNGEEKFFHASGYANIERNAPIERDSIFRIFSMTKPMTAVTAMAMVERGKLDLTAPVSEYLEGFRDQQVMEADGSVRPAKRPTLVRDLFSMTSGLCYPSFNSPAERAVDKLFGEFKAEEAAGHQPTTLEVANRIGRTPLVFDPGERWLYGTSADVMGAVIETVAEQPLDEVMANVLFHPLKMKDTGFFVPEDKRERFATLYQSEDGRLTPFTANHLALNNYLTKPRFISGGAGLTSTIDDAMTFGQMLLGHGELNGERIISARSVDYLSHNHLTHKQLVTVDWDVMAGHGYGGFMRMLLEPAKSHSLGIAGEYGWDGWTGPYLSICPSEGMVLVLMQQLTGAGTSAVTRKVRNVIFSRVK